MMTALYWGLGIVVLLAACRWLPGTKCITWCRIKKFKYDRATKRIEGMIVWDDPHGRHRKVKTLDYTGYTTRQLEKIYNATEPFGCRQFDEKSPISDARNKLKERIAEGHLLELQ